MTCQRHGLSAGPDGRCALCHRDDRAKESAAVRHTDRQVHRVLRLIVAVVACLAAFAALLALLDTSPAPSPAHDDGPVGVAPTAMSPGPYDSLTRDRLRP